MRSGGRFWLNSEIREGNQIISDDSITEPCTNLLSPPDRQRERAESELREEEDQLMARHRQIEEAISHRQEAERRRQARQIGYGATGKDWHAFGMITVVFLRLGVTWAI